MMADQVPFHETKQVMGVTEACRYNDHTLCNGAGGRCRCDCHGMASIMATQEGPVMQAPKFHSRLSDTPPDKYCPVCKVQRPSEENFCRADGTKLSSLRCPECGTPGEQTDLFCAYCGCSMKADQQLEDAAIGSQVTEDQLEISVSDVEDMAAKVAEANMRAAMATKVKTVPAPPKISIGMYK